MGFTHYVIVSVTPMVWVSCHCKAATTHLVGKEKGVIPISFYKTLRSGVTQ